MEKTGVGKRPRSRAVDGHPLHTSAHEVGELHGSRATGGNGGFRALDAKLPLHAYLAQTSLPIVAIRVHVRRSAAAGDGGDDADFVAVLDG